MLVNVDFRELEGGLEFAGIMNKKLSHVLIYRRYMEIKAFQSTIEAFKHIQSLCTD